MTLAIGVPGRVGSARPLRRRRHARRRRESCFARAERCVEDADRAVVTFERAVPPSLLRAVLVVAFCDRRAGDAPRLPPFRAAELLRELGFGFCVAGEEIGRREERVGSDRAVSMLAEEEEAAAWSRGEAVLRGDDLAGALKTLAGGPWPHPLPCRRERPPTSAGRADRQRCHVCGCARVTRRRAWPRPLRGGEVAVLSCGRCRWSVRARGGLGSRIGRSGSS